MGILIITSKRLGTVEVFYDDFDYKLVSEHRWFACKGQNSNTIYARTAYIKEGRYRSRLMHRLILLNTPRSLHIDHKNGNGLDNRRINLRICTPSQNSANQSIAKNNKTGCKGINKIIGKTKISYRAQITVDKKQINLGCFKSLKEAAAAYNEAAINYFGEFAKVNILY